MSNEIGYLLDKLKFMMRDKTSNSAGNYFFLRINFMCSLLQKKSMNRHSDKQKCVTDLELRSINANNKILLNSLLYNYKNKNRKR